MVATPPCRKSRRSLGAICILRAIGRGKYIHPFKVM